MVQHICETDCHNKIAPFSIAISIDRVVVLNNNNILTNKNKFSFNYVYYVAKSKKYNNIEGVFRIFIIIYYK